ncbi:hypothetical protein KM043_007848 [Ampulex compressa]|nr:hypothetical protein KM043_007848 [Ampulex compressa]
MDVERMGKPRGNFIIRLADGIWLTMENAHDVPAGVKKENTSKAPHKTFLPPRCVKQRRDGWDSSRAAEGGREAGRDNKQKPRSAQGSKDLRFQLFLAKNGPKDEVTEARCTGNWLRKSLAELRGPCGINEQTGLFTRRYSNHRMITNSRIPDNFTLLLETPLNNSTIKVEQ